MTKVNHFATNEVLFKVIKPYVPVEDVFELNVELYCRGSKDSVIEFKSLSRLNRSITLTDDQVYELYNALRKVIVLPPDGIQELIVQLTVHTPPLVRCMMVPVLVDEKLNGHE